MTSLINSSGCYKSKAGDVSNNELQKTCWCLGANVARKLRYLWVAQQSFGSMCVRLSFSHAPVTASGNVLSCCFLGWSFMTEREGKSCISVLWNWAWILGSVVIISRRVDHSCVGWLVLQSDGNYCSYCGNQIVEVKADLNLWVGDCLISSQISLKACGGFSRPTNPACIHMYCFGDAPLEVSWQLLFNMGRD